jgi:3-hydroxyisobutyrate dehydrogenase
MAADAGPVGFVGLGNMGGPMAANLAAAGIPLLVYDKAGTADRAPDGAEIAQSLDEVARRAGTVLLSLPAGAAVLAVAGEIAAAAPRAADTVIDTSTIGVAAAGEVAGILARAGITYLDAPVSGGVAGARAGTIAVMAAGPLEAFERARPLLSAMAANLFHVGTRQGQGQAMKLANNFLSGVAMAATSEAVRFGETQGLDMKTMLDVLNVSTGRNTATSDKFPNRILTGTHDAGFTTTLIHKDVRLYLEAVADAGVRGVVGRAVGGTLAALETDLPGEDFTRIYPWTVEHDEA